MTEESINQAKEELKRVDHLIYVSLKYTRTCDIFKSIIERLINAINFMLEAVLKKIEQEGKIDKIPEQAGLRCNAIKEHVTDAKILEIVDFYLGLRKLNRSSFTRAREFRRHVTMTCTIDTGTVEINIDNITERFNLTKQYLGDIISFLGVSE